MKITVRETTEEDVAALVALHLEFRDSLQRAAPSAAEFEAAIRRVLLGGNMYFGIAQEGGSALGYYSLRCHYSSWTLGREAVLEDMYVSAGSRRLGVGGLLLTHALEQCGKVGCGSISLDTNEANEASNKLYQNFGFTSARARWKGARQVRYDKKLV